MDLLCSLLEGFPHLGDLIEDLLGGLLGSNLQDFLNSLLELLGEQVNLQQAALFFDQAGSLYGPAFEMG
jgi:hypothetical protein